MESKIAILTMAIAAVTMLIALGQLIVAIMALDKKRAPPSNNWIVRNIDWLMIALLVCGSLYGAWSFLRIEGAPTKSQIHTFTASAILMSMAYTNYMVRLALMQVSKARRTRDEFLGILADEVDRIAKKVDSADSLQ